MKIKNIAGIKITELQRTGKMPQGLKWSKALPQAYSINIIEGEKNTVIACSDSFGGGLAYAVIEGKLDLIGAERELDREEESFLAKRYPEFLEVINNI